MESKWIIAGIFILSIVSVLGGAFSKYTKENETPKDDRIGAIVEYWCGFAKFLRDIIMGKVILK